MGLYERLLRLEDPPIPVHQFIAAAAEVSRGTMTNLQARTALNLSGAEGTEANALIARVTSAALSRVEIHDVLLLAELRIPPFNTVAAVKTRLGV
jgi:hypothetical protein